MKAIRDLTRFGAIAAVTALLVAVPFGAGAAVKKQGTWPAADAAEQDRDKKVSFEFDGRPSDGLQKLAREAGWSLVLSKGVAEGGPDVHIAVDDQPADAVLDALFAQTDVVVHRSGTLVTVVPDDGAKAQAAPAAAEPAPAAAPEPTPVAKPVPTVRGEDRDVVGGTLTVPANEVVHTVTATGGNVVVDGTVTGDLVLVGGSATLRNGGRVLGNVMAMGGRLTLEDGARVDGHVEMLGGKLDRAPGAVIAGGITGNGVGDRDDDDVLPSVSGESSSESTGGLAAAGHAIAARVSRLSLLFVLGCVLLALLSGRMDKLRVEIAARPMRSFAVGVLGAIAASLGAVVLCITIIGIPFVLLGALLGVVATYGAVCAILTTVGAALVGHRTDNVYVHLLVGCVLLFVVGAIPYVGGVVSFALAMTAIGVLFTTRAGGLLDRRTRKMV